MSAARGLYRIAVTIVVAVSLAALGTIAIGDLSAGPLRSFEDQMCGLPREWLASTRRGYNERRAGQIALLPRTPAYMSTGGQGWTHSGPWDYLQRVPLVLYGPGRIAEGVEVDDPATLADVAPTFAHLLGQEMLGEGRVLLDVAEPGRPPRLIVTVVWDGGGWNALRRYPDAWPNLAQIIAGGTTFTNARVGSSPSVTPAVHTTLGTGVFPATHAITGVPVRNDAGVVVDSFFGNSGRGIEVSTFAEVWDEANRNQPLVGMVGYEPWHLGMVGKGAEAPGGDHDHAVWINRARNTWVTKRDYFALPAAFRDQSDLRERLDVLDRAEGEADRHWMRVPLDERNRIEETPAFIDHHEAKLEQMISEEGYGADGVTDLLFTNFKHIDRLAHYFNMKAPEVRAVMASTDGALGSLLEHLDSTIGHGRYVLVVTADHGLQPNDSDVGGFAIDPNEVERDIVAKFGPVVRSVWPTEVFLLQDELERRGLAIEDIARFLGDYRLRDNATRIDEGIVGAGRFGPSDRVFEMAIPARMLHETSC
ncbi:MAG TPA: alkaline phosphatase family protein [Actinomycetota bacterium]|nr:alkaline phosphatase family protein [Actinomycetota bacterium]